MASSTVDKLVGFNKDVYAKEHKTGARQEFFDNFGGLEALSDLLKTDLQDGLSSNEDLEARRAIFGTNEMPKRKPRTLISLIVEACQDLVIIILSCAAVVSIVLGTVFPESVYNPACDCFVRSSTGWVEGVAILVACLVVVLVGSIQDYDKELKFRKLGVCDVRYITVVRGGAPVEIPTTEIVAGDVVVLDWGKAVPADGYVILSDDMKVDESSVTGEPEPVSKNFKDPWLMANTNVINGRGKMLVTATGPRTEWGQTLSMLQEAEADATPLQEELEGMVIAIGKMGLGFGVTTFYVLAIYWAIDAANAIAENGWQDQFITPLIDALIIGITLLVVGIPEGLPLAVVISLAFSMKAMTQDNNLVRHLSACETMGGATNICSDKTGTLTKNQMTVMQGWLGGQSFTSVPWDLMLSQEFGETMRIGLALNSTSMRQGKTKVVGFPTEMALLDMIDKVDGTDQYMLPLRKSMEKEVLLQVPFNSETKRMMTAVLVKDLVRVFVKGAPDRLIEESAFLMKTDGSLVPVNEDLRQQMMAKVDELSSNGFRTLLFGFVDHPAGNFLHDPNASTLSSRYLVDAKTPGLSTNIIVQGIVGIEDPVRDGVPEAVATCVRAGITVRMVTGDYAKTAAKIAEQCGIKTSKGIVLTGEEFRKMSDDQVDLVLPQLQVLARSQPADKLRLVKRLRALNQIVAVTGDGTNDAPALKEADVGLAMGIAGTDVAKEACDIIIMDDNFSSIVSSVKWGRNVYRAVRKFLQFQLTVNVAALVLVFIGAVTRYGAPLRAVQLLWVNLIMDVIAALSFATSKPTPELLLEKPHGKTERIISNRMWKHILGQAVFQLAIMFGITYGGFNIPWTTGYLLPRSRQLYTIVFNSFVWCQLFNEFNASTVDDELNVFHHLYSNPAHLFLWTLSCGLQAIIVEFGGDAFKTSPLSWDQWLFCIAMGTSSLITGFLLRLVPTPESPHLMEVLEFWNKKPVLMPVEKERVTVAGIDMDMVSVNMKDKDKKRIEEERKKVIEELDEKN